MDFYHPDNLNYETLKNLENFTMLPMVIFNEEKLLYSSIFFQDAIREEKIDPVFNNVYHAIKNLEEKDHQEICVTNSFNEVFYFDVKLKEVIYESIPAWFATLIDISDRKKYENNVTQVNKLRALIIEISNSILDITDLNAFLNFVLLTTLKALDKSTLGTILILEEEHFKTAASVGYSHDVYTFKLPLNESFIYRETQGTLDRIVNIKDTRALSYYIPVTTEYGEEVFIHSAVSAPIYFHGKLYGLINVDSLEVNAFTDDDIKSIEFISKSIEIAITNRLLYEEKAYLSRFDRITGLYNRHFFDEHSDVVIKKANRYHESFHLVMIDIDNLKLVNDEYSHLVGDAIITKVAAIIKESMRESDVFARYGGDEFVGLLFNSSIVDLVEKFEILNQEIINSPVEYQGHLVSTSISYGIATFNDDGNSIYDLIRVADERMYTYKNRQKV